MGSSRNAEDIYRNDNYQARGFIRSTVISFQERSLFLKEINRIETISGQGRKT